MFNLFSDLRGFAIQARDAEKGTVDDIYFDDETWDLRYVVADIGPIFFGHKALIGAALLNEPDMTRRIWPVDLNKSDVEKAPDAGTAEPVSAQEERKAHRAITDWPAFLVGPAGAAYTPILAEQQLDEIRRAHWKDAEQRPPGDRHLRSMAEVRGYKVRGRNDGIGTVDDFLIDTKTWRLDYLVVDTGDWLPGKRVVLSVDKVAGVDWNQAAVNVDLTGEQVESARSIDSIAALERSDQAALIAQRIVHPF